MASDKVRSQVIAQAGIRYRELLAEADVGVPAARLREYGIMRADGSLCVPVAEARDAAAAMAWLAVRLERGPL